ncbi:MAG: holo-ACP synthase [Clostridia bacterium]|nr:holo-ACP synthase [Clostridia bacterium]
MIIGIGIDIVEISRIKKLMENEHAIERLLTPAEIELMKKKAKPHEFFAGRFAAKEAVSKAFGTGISKCPPNEVEILALESGEPYVNLQGHAKELYDNKNAARILISITHEKEYAAATAILEGKD